MSPNMEENDRGLPINEIRMYLLQLLLSDLLSRDSIGYNIINNADIEQIYTVCMVTLMHDLTYL